MLVTIDNQVIAVKFQHNQTGENKGTKCLITKGKESDGEFVAAGFALLHPKDNFCKEKGRRVALAKALRDTDFNKTQKASFWEAYRNWGINPRW